MFIKHIFCNIVYEINITSAEHSQGNLSVHDLKVQVGILRLVRLNYNLRTLVNTSYRCSIQLLVDFHLIFVLEIGFYM